MSVVSCKEEGESEMESARVAFAATRFLLYGDDLPVNLGSEDSNRIMRKAKALAERIRANENGIYDRESEMIDRINKLHSFNLPPHKESIWKNPMFQVYFAVGVFFVLVLLYAAIFN